MTGEALRRAAGEPDVVRDTTSVHTLAIAPQAKPVKSESWQYTRNGTTFSIYLRDDIATSISILPMFGATLGASNATPPADPMGLRMGDTLGVLLIKTGAVPSIDPKSGITVLSAMLNVTRHDLRYTFMILDGRINSESIFYVTPATPSGQTAYQPSEAAIASSVWSTSLAACAVETNITSF